MSRYLDHLKGEMPTTPIPAHKKGRPCFISNEGLGVLKDEVSESTSTMQCFTLGSKGTFDSKLYEIHRREHGLNDKAEIHCSPKTLYNTKKKCEFHEEEVQPKNGGRIEAFNNLRTPISFCCLLNTLQSVVHRANYHSVDDVSVLINAMDQSIKVLTDKNSKNSLRKKKVSVTTHEENHKQRVITFNCTISGDYGLTVTCLNFLIEISLSIKMHLRS
jgi:hypothetical protein